MIVKIWLLKEDTNFYEQITLVDNGIEAWESLNSLFHEMKSSKDYKPIRACVIETDEKLKCGDIPYLSPGKPVLTKKAIDALKFLITTNAEVLPIHCEGRELYILKVTNQLDAIDLQKSDILFMPDGERIMRVKKFVFKPEVVLNQNIFKIKNQLYAKVFVSDEFRNKVIESNLQGFKFIEVWDSNE